MVILGSGSTAKRVSLTNGLTGSLVGDRVEGVENRLLSLRSSTMLLSGTLLLACRLCELEVMIDGLSGLDFPSTGAGVVETAAWRRCATAGMMVAASPWTGCSGVGGADSPRTAVVGRKREAMTMR